MKVENKILCGSINGEGAWRRCWVCEYVWKRLRDVLTDSPDNSCWVCYTDTPHQHLIWEDILSFITANITELYKSTAANDHTIGYSTSNSANSSKFHYLALLMVVVLYSSNFSPLALACLACGASVALGWLSRFNSAIQ